MVPCRITRNAGGQVAWNFEILDYGLIVDNLINKDNLIEGCTTVQGEDGDEANGKIQMMTDAHLIYLMMMNDDE